MKTLGRSVGPSLRSFSAAIASITMFFVILLILYISGSQFVLKLEPLRQEKIILALLVLSTSLTSCVLYRQINFKKGGA